MFQGIAHTALGVQNFDASYAFYVTGLGLPVYAAWGEKPSRCMLLDVGGSYLEIFEGYETAGERSRWLHVALNTVDVPGAYTQALQQGAKPKTEPKTIHISSRPEEHDFTIAFVYGPDGEEIEFFKMD